MNNRKFLGVTILTISITSLLITVGLNKSRHSYSAQNNVSSSTGKELKEVYKRNNNYSDSVIVNKILGDFFYSINKKDFDTAYSMNDTNYEKLFGLSKDIFKSIYNYDEEKSFNITELSSLSDRYVAKVCVKGKKGDINKYFTIFKRGSDYKLIDFGILSEEKIENKTTQIDNVKFKLTQKLKLIEDRTAYVISVNSKSDKPLDLKGDRWSIYVNDNNTLYPNESLSYSTEDYSIYSGIDKQFIVYFKSSNPDEMGIMLNDNSKKILFKF